MLSTCVAHQLFFVARGHKHCIKTCTGTPCPSSCAPGIPELQKANAPGLPARKGHVVREGNAGKWRFAIVEQHSPSVVVLRHVYVLERTILLCIRAQVVYPAGQSVHGGKPHSAEPVFLCYCCYQNTPTHVMVLDMLRISKLVLEAGSRATGPGLGLRPLIGLRLRLRRCLGL